MHQNFAFFPGELVFKHITVYPLEKEMATHSSILAWENPMDRGAWWDTVCGVAKSRT